MYVYTQLCGSELVVLMDSLRTSGQFCSHFVRPRGPDYIHSFVAQQITLKIAVNRGFNVNHRRSANFKNSLTAIEIASSASDRHVEKVHLLLALDQCLYSPPVGRFLGHVHGRHARRKMTSGWRNVGVIINAPDISWCLIRYYCSSMQLQQQQVFFRTLHNKLVVTRRTWRAARSKRVESSIFAQHVTEWLNAHVLNTVVGVGVTHVPPSSNTLTAENIARTMQFCFCTMSSIWYLSHHEDRRRSVGGHNNVTNALHFFVKE